MPSDDYTAFSGGGALKLKGGKVSKSKGKKKKDKTAAGLERALSTGDSADNSSRDVEKPVGKNKKHRKDPQDEDEQPAQEEDDGGEEPVEYKTEAQKRHEEYKRKKMLELAQSSSSRPELLKTHKERVEELNTYLSKLSEHHDMPKIGPG
ncbi:mitochondrial 54S ribosomal protein YmL35 [Pestalotiopsis sp. IQ-011]